MHFVCFVMHVSCLCFFFLLFDILSFYVAIWAVSLIGVFCFSGSLPLWFCYCVMLCYVCLANKILSLSLFLLRNQWTTCNMYVLKEYLNLRSLHESLFGSSRSKVRRLKFTLVLICYRFYATRIDDRKITTLWEVSFFDAFVRGKSPHRAP